MLPDNHKNPLTEKVERPANPILSGSSSLSVGSCDFFDQKKASRIRYNSSVISNTYNDKSNTSTPVRTFQNPLEHFQNTQNDGLGGPQDRRPHVPISNHTKPQVSTGMHSVPVGADRAQSATGEGLPVSNLRPESRSEKGLARRLRNQCGVSGEGSPVLQAGLSRRLASDMGSKRARVSKQTEPNNRKARVLESVRKVSKNTTDIDSRWKTNGHFNVIQ